MRADAVPAQHIAPHLTVRPTHGGPGPLSEGQQAPRTRLQTVQRGGGGVPTPPGTAEPVGQDRGASSSPQNTAGRGNGARLGAPGVRSFLTPALNPRGTCEAAEGSRRRLPGPVWPLSGVLLSQTRDGTGTQRPPGGPPAAGPLPQGGRLLAPSASSPCPCHRHQPRWGAACLGGPPEDRAAFKGDSEATGRA